MLRALPRAHGTWVDSSEPMEQLARKQLADVADRVSFVRGDAEALDELPLERADVVVTSRMLHHFNLDHFGAPRDRHDRYERIRDQFTGPRKQPLKPHRHDFPLREVQQHLAWIEAAGFDPPDVPWRTFRTALAHYVASGCARPEARRPARVSPR